MLAHRTTVNKTKIRGAEKNFNKEIKPSVLFNVAMSRNVKRRTMRKMNNEGIRKNKKLIAKIQTKI